MIHLKILPVLLLSFTVFCSCRTKPTEIYVGTNGKSGNPGTAEAPLPDIQSALDAAGELKTKATGQTVSVILLPGTYHLTTPLIISAGFSNLTLKGSGPSEVTVTGSKRLTPDWKKFDQNISVTNVPENIDFDQLIANGELQILARYPNYNENGGHFQGHAADALSNERIKSWKHPAGTIFNAIHAYEWGDFHYVITGLDSSGKPIMAGGHQNNRLAPPHPEYRMVENVFEELDSPGEWFLDKENHRLYYWPGENINIETAVFEGVILKSLIEITGDEQSPVRNVTISGIKFEFSRRTFLEPYEPLLRSDWTIYRGGAVFMQGTEDCSVRDCEFSNLGGNAIFISKYNHGAQIEGNHIHDCGASGVCFVGDPTAVRSPAFEYQQFVALADMDTLPGPQNNLYPLNCRVENNLIHRTGRIEKQTAGIQISMSMNITVSHNSIYEVPRAGINIGDGTWGGHILQYNDVFNTVLETGDHGSFNSWGRDRYWHPNRHTMDSLTTGNPMMPLWDAVNTTIIRNNRFRCDHGWDIDLDDGSSNYLIYNNLCLNGGIKLREGFYRTVENNIIVNNSFHPHVWFKKSGDIFRKNIVMTDYRDIRLDGWGQEIDQNLFPDEASLIKARKQGTDPSSNWGDPIFTNPATGDFTVQENSPAIKLGFENFSMDEFGVTAPKLKKMAKTPEGILRMVPGRE